MATVIKLGPEGPGYAAEHMELTVGQISNALGDSAQVPQGQVSAKEAGMIGVPAGPPKAKKEKVKFVPNMLRKAVEELWGHAYGYFDALKANDLDERHVLFKGQRIVIPARGRRAKMVQAAKWRKYLGSS